MCTACSGPYSPAATHSFFTFLHAPPSHFLPSLSEAAPPSNRGPLRAHAAVSSRLARLAAVTFPEISQVRKIARLRPLRCISPRHVTIPTLRRASVRRLPHTHSRPPHALSTSFPAAAPPCTVVPYCSDSRPSLHPQRAQQQHPASQMHAIASNSHPGEPCLARVALRPLLHYIIASAMPAPR